VAGGAGHGCDAGSVRRAGLLDAAVAVHQVALTARVPLTGRGGVATWWA
jgi:hypothetical protein